MQWWHPTDRIKEDWHRCQLRDNLPQGKVGRLATDVRPGPILLTKKKKKEKEKTTKHLKTKGRKYQDYSMVDRSERFLVRKIGTFTRLRTTCLFFHLLT